MKEIRGDLIKLANEGKFDVIIHGCNCMCTMGAGIAKAIKQKWPVVYIVDKKTNKGDIRKLGTYSYAVIHREGFDTDLTIVNAYTQYKYGRDRPHVDYIAIQKVFQEIKRNFSGKRIAYPKIGAGLAGGDWKKIKEIIDTELKGEDHTLVILDRYNNKNW